MDKLFFHDGNIVSLIFSGYRKKFRCSLKMDLYDDIDSAVRRRRLMVFKALRSIDFSGDFAKIAINYTAGSIEDGVFEDFGNYQKLTVKVTGGVLVVEGVLDKYKLI